MSQRVPEPVELAATGKPVRISGISIVRIARGKIVDAVISEPELAFHAQTGCHRPSHGVVWHNYPEDS
jgi:hypothetical protein